MQKKAGKNRLFRVEYGARTHDLLNHNQTLSPTELQPQSQVLDSNQCEWFCRPPPRLSDNLTYPVHFFSLFTDREQSDFVNTEVSKGFEPLSKHP